MSVDYNGIVSEGASFLDVEYGADWAHKVDLYTLDMNSPETCDKTQVSGRGFFDALKDFNLDDRGAMRYGFNRPYGGDFETLRDYWVRLINSRRGAALAPSKSIVSKSALDAAIARCDELAKHHPAYVEGLTAQGFLAHLLLDLDIQIEIGA